MVFVLRLPSCGRSGCLLAALGLVACADPATRYEEFGTRYTELNPPAPPFVCSDNPCDLPEPGAIDGTYLWTISTEFVRPTPVLYRADITTVAADVGLDLTIVATPLSWADRSTEVGSATTYGPFTVEPGGCLDAAVTLVAPGTANPLTKTDFEANLVLTGQVCPDSDPPICGTVTGQVLRPLERPLTSSTFTFDPAIAPGVYTEPPMINCEGELADPPPEE
jgi:hypothetical protein